MVHKMLPFPLVRNRDRNFINIGKANDILSNFFYSLDLSKVHALTENCGHSVGAISANYRTVPYYGDKHVLELHVHELREHMNRNELHVVPTDLLCSCHHLNTNREPEKYQRKDSQNQ